MTEKNKGGRPTKLTEYLYKKIDEYLDGGYDVFPSVIGLSLYIDIADTTLYKWSKEDERFSRTLRKVQSMSQQVLVEKGLMKEFDSGLTKFILSAKHEYREKKDISSEDGSFKPVERVIIEVVTKNE